MKEPDFTVLGRWGADGNFQNWCITRGVGGEEAEGECFLLIDLLGLPDIVVLGRGFHRRIGYIC